ncbi:MAG: GNAT family N-acetyltransferase [Candidimonas sp.]|nr:GNAT family N-acetyltransferase [Candidimonas sp.]
MDREEPQLFILERLVDIEPFLEEVTHWADSAKSALGFLAAGVFFELARKGNLFVAVTLRGGQLVYAGHLLFDARNARATVLQIFAKPEARRHGVARSLLARLKKHLTELHFISIYAGVADDLSEANAFWEKNGFYIQRTRPGGKARNRTILVRCHELSSPQLFQRSGIDSNNPFGLDVALQAGKPIYLLDLNVLFDLGPRRPRNAAAIDLFRAERHGACHLALSAELKEELVRTAAKAPRTDPMQSWAAIFITFPLPPDVDKNRLVNTLGEMIFPVRAHSGSYTANDLSDLNHLATAVYHRLTGFITSDEAILAAGKKIEEAFRIHIVSPQAFQPSDELHREELFEVAGTSEPLVASPLATNGQDELRRMLLQLGVTDSDVISRWGTLDSEETTFHRLAVFADERLAGYLASRRQANVNSVTGLLAIDEANAQSRDVGRLLLNKLLFRAREVAPSRVYLQLAPQQAAAREMATGLGFAGAENGSDLSKLVLNRVVTSQNWTKTVSDLDDLAKLKLPAACPPFKDIEQQIEILCPDGNRRFVRLHEVESSLSPTIFCLPGRPAVITPILRDFADQLLEHSPQTTLLPRARAGQFSERHYFSSDRTLKHFRRGTIMLFYESGRGKGSSSIVAIARVQRAYLKPKDVIGQVDFDPSVLSSETLSFIGSSESKTVTAFDNLIVLPNPVPLRSLQKIGCGEPTQLITTRPITSEQLNKILIEALCQ